MTAPFGSETVPVNVAVKVCAEARLEESRKAAKRICAILFFMASPVPLRLSRHKAIELLDYLNPALYRAQRSKAVRKSRSELLLSRLATCALGTKRAPFFP